MGRVYEMTIDRQAVTTVVELLAFKPASNKPCIVRDAWATQYTDYGDAQAEGSACALVRGNTTDPSGGSTNTPAIVNPSLDPAFSGSARQLDTTLATSGSPTTHAAKGWNVQSGYDERRIPETNLFVAAAVWCCLRLLVAPADSISISAGIILEELG